MSTNLLQNIQTSKGVYSFKEKVFELGVKAINKDIAEENLFLFKDIMDKNELEFSLAYGTLLGAIRENDFIEYDEDIDVIILDENRVSFIDLLFDFRKHGFEVGRYFNDLLSLVREGEYIDVYIFKKACFGFRSMGDEIIKERFLINTVKYSFLGKSFNIPEDYKECLLYHYGHDWKIPIKNQHAEIYKLSVKIKIRFKKLFPELHKILRSVIFKKRINEINNI